MKSLLILVLASVALAAKQGINGDGENKVLIDWLLNAQLTSLDGTFKRSKMTMLNLGDHTLPGGVTAKGVKLGDLTTLQSTDHAYMWTSPDNVVQADAFIGLKNMTLTVDTLTYNGQSFPATLTVGVNSLGFHQTLTFQETSCQEVYSKIAFYKLDKVTIFTSLAEYNGQDVSEFVKISVLPYINGLMQQKPFLDIVESFMNICNHPGVAKIMKPK